MRMNCVTEIIQRALQENHSGRAADHLGDMPADRMNFQDLFRSGIRHDLDKTAVDIHPHCLAVCKKRALGGGDIVAFLTGLLLC